MLFIRYLFLFDFLVLVNFSVGDGVGSDVVVVAAAALKLTSTLIIGGGG